MIDLHTDTPHGRSDRGRERVLGMKPSPRGPLDLGVCTTHIFTFLPQGALYRRTVHGRSAARPVGNDETAPIITSVILARNRKTVKGRSIAIFL